MEELDLPKFNPGPIHVNQFKKINKKGCGNIPKAFKKPVPTPKSAPNCNDSTSKNARKGPLIQTNNPNPNRLQDDLLKEFVDKEKISQRKRTGQLLIEWKASDNDGVHLGKKTSASLALLREAFTDKINDVNETWEDMAGNNEGNKITQNMLSRAVN